MALPIKQTPILTGKNALSFLKQIKENENKKIPSKEMRGISENYNKMKAIDKSGLI